ncbi:MAG: tryptophan 7-halogenase [Acidobacteriota bacterium]
MDCLILGGGPAGAAAARLLAGRGHDVTLVTRPDVGGPAFGVSIPPSTDKLFRMLDIEAHVARADAVRSTGHTVWWRPGDERIETFAGQARGWQVRLDRFSAALLDAAREAGARVVCERVESLDAARRAFDATYVIDATGRAGVAARARGWRTPESGPRTVALAAVWRAAEGWPVPDDTHTLIEAYEDGWAWSIPFRTPDTAARTSDRTSRRYIAVMVDPERSRLAAGRARDVYLGELAKTTRFRALVGAAALEEGPSGWDATMYGAARFAADDLLLAGDAGSFVDPLSSIGVKKALASGWLAAVAVRTALLDPAMRQTAFAFFDTREREVYAAFRARTREYLAEAAAGRAHAFWADRAADDAASAAPAADPGRAHAVQAAWDELRAEPRLRVRRGGNVRVEPRPAVRENLIVLEPRLVSSDDDPGVGYVHDVDVVALVDLAPAFDDVGALFEAYVRQRPPVGLQHFAAALATAVARQWLVCYK